MRRKIRRHRFRTPSLFESFHIAIEDNDILKVKELLLNKDVKPEQQKSRSIQTAVELGRYSILKLLLEDGRANPAEFCDAFVKNAASGGHSKILRLLLKDPRVNPSEDENYALRLAAENGHYQCLKLLYNDERTNPYMNDFEILRYAALNGHHKVVEFLLKDKKIRYSRFTEQSFRDSFSQGHYITASKFVFGKLKKEIRENINGQYNDYIKFFNREKIKNF
jgi:hypothetical protein